MIEKEFEVKFINKSLLLKREDLEYIKSLGIRSFKIKLIPDIEEICKIENLSKKLVEKISITQKIPLDIALGVVRSKGKIIKWNKFWLIPIYL